MLAPRMSREEACTYLTISKSTLERLCRAGALEKVSVSTRRVAITGESVAALGEKLRGAGGSAAGSQGTRAHALILNVAAWHPNFAAVVDALLGDRFPGVMVSSDGATQILVWWSARLGYNADAMATVIRRADDAAANQV